MAKTLYYNNNAHDATSIINNSDVGSLTDNEDNETIDATNVDTTEVRNVLGEDTNNIGLLCTSNKINKWALYKPGKLKVENDYLIYSEPDTYKIGDFLGYNHQAEKPEFSDYSSNSTYDDSTSTVQINYTLDRKEVNWDEIQTNPHFWIITKKGSTTKQEDVYDAWYSLNTTGEPDPIDYDVSNESDDISLTIEWWIGSDQDKLAKIDYFDHTIEYQEDTYITVVHEEMIGNQPEWQNEQYSFSYNYVKLDIRIPSYSGGYFDIWVHHRGTIEQSNVTNEWFDDNWNNITVDIPQNWDDNEGEVILEMRKV